MKKFYKLGARFQDSEGVFEKSVHFKQNVHYTCILDSSKRFNYFSE